MKSLLFSGLVLILMFLIAIGFYLDWIDQYQLKASLFGATLLWFVGKFFLERKKA
ncbi:hypothetical protein [Shivajiella indica]|uniref:Uncharacterized protein n=1 Tax=Shivajiella indica TaxID=872115 RepID=A0ABW5BCP9_9BACT